VFEWKSEYSVNVPSIDGQHQNLFRMAAELRDAVMAGTSEAAVAKTMDRLVQYIQVHFAYEERLMRVCDYPELAAHLAEHEALTRQVLRFQRDLRVRPQPIAIRLLKLLKSWLENHILKSDRKYVPYLNERGVA